MFDLLCAFVAVSKYFIGYSIHLKSFNKSIKAKPLTP